MQVDELILTEILNCSRSELYLTKPVLTEEENQAFLKMKERYSAGEPLQYIIGSADFMGHRLIVNEDVLIPRPETEILVEQICKSFRSDEQLNILDLGTGSGCIAISLAKYFKQAALTAVDVSMNAIEIARGNANRHGVDTRIDFIYSDMREYLRNTSIRFDVIVSNPPYICSGDLKSLPDDVQKEPKIALDGGGDGLNYYRDILAEAGELLRVDGRICFEFGDGQLEGIVKISSGYVVENVFKDYTNTDRIVFLKKV